MGNYQHNGAFSLAEEYAPIPGCTVSGELFSGCGAVRCFSLAPQTDISAELFPYHKVIHVCAGHLQVTCAGGVPVEVHAGEVFITPADSLVGVASANGAVYIELEIRRTAHMNEVIKAGEVFRLADIVPYQDGRIVNMDIVRNEHMKFAVMAFDAGTGLSEHAAPGDAIVFALDGDGTIVYEGTEYPIHSGENFRFAKGGLHAVKAPGRFKMALLLTLD